MRPCLIGGIIFLTFILGCNSGSPVTPGNQPAKEYQSESASLANHRTLWGIWDVSIDSKSMTIDAVPLRSADFTCNVTQFMQPPSSPTNMILLSLEPGSDPSSGYFEVKVTLKHPFPGLNQYNGFDVRGIFMSNGSIVGNYDNSVLRAGPGDSVLLNADGYTRWWNYSEFTSYNKIFGFTSGKLAPPNHPTSTVNPYKYFADGLDSISPVTSIDPSTRGFFATVPGANSRQYNIQFKQSGGSTVFDFQYAVDASWAPPDPSYAPSYPQEAFSLSANCQEAFAISVNDEGSTAFFVSPAEKGGVIALNIEVYDWQGGVSPAGVPGEISGIWVEGSVFGGVIDVLSSATILPGSTSVSSVFEVTIGSLNLSKSGEEEIFITVESASPDTYEPQIPNGSSFAYPSSALAAYYLTSVTISGTSPIKKPTVLSIDPKWGYQDEIYNDVVISGSDFEPSATVELEITPGNKLSVSDVTWVNSGKITVDLNLTGATLGLYDVKVKNPIVPEGVLDDGFEVKKFTAIWPLTQGNPQHTGTIGLDGPAGPSSGSWAPKWNITYPEVGLGNAVPVFLNNTMAFFTIAFNYNDNNHIPLVAVDIATQTIKWTKVFNWTTHSTVVPLGLNRIGTIVLVWDWPTSNLYGLDAETGTTLWGPLTGAGPFSSDAYASLDNDGNFIFPSSSGIKSINPNTGAVNWTSSTGNPGYCDPAVGTDGTIYVYGSLTNAKICALDPATGVDKWGGTGPTIGQMHNGLVYNPVTNAIIVFSQSGLRSLKDNGTSCSTMWSVSIPYAWYCSPAVAPNGDIYLVDGNGTLRRIDPNNGSTLNSSSGYGSGYGSRPAIGKNGKIYVNTESYIRCFNSDCSLRWSFYGSWDSYWGAPAIGQNGQVFSARRTNGLCAWYD